MPEIIGKLNQWGHGVNRRVRGALADPVAFYQGALDDVLPTAEEQESSLRMRGSVMGNPAQQAIQEKMTNIGLGAMTVYHGSPHKFDAFDSSKIGTGEGAQAYGHGLYMAEAPEVAQQYQKNLNRTKAGIIKVDGKEVTGAHAWVADALRSAKGDAAAVENALSRISLSPDSPHVQERFAALRDIAGKNIEYEPPGALYKVDLPDDKIAGMLDWDKPLSEQPAIKSLIEQYEKTVPEPVNVPPEWAAVAKKAAPLADEQSGADLYRRLSGLPKNAQLFGADRGTDWQAAMLLSKMGIPGIKYLDGMSRGKGGTSNYVVFPGNEGILNILERNGQPVKGVLAK